VRLVVVDVVGEVAPVSEVLGYVEVRGRTAEPSPFRGRRRLGGALALALGIFTEQPVGAQSRFLRVHSVFVARHEVSLQELDSLECSARRVIVLGARWHAASDGGS